MFCVAALARTHCARRGALPCTAMRAISWATTRHLRWPARRPRPATDASGPVPLQTKRELGTNLRAEEVGRSLNRFRLVHEPSGSA